MPGVSLTGNDTVVLNNKVYSQFADGDVAKLTFPNELMGVKTGKNGNSLYAFNNTGKQCELMLRILRGSDDDKALLSLLTQMINSPTTFVLLAGTFIKVVGDGAGNITNDTYVLSGGVFTKQVEVEDNADGTTEQAVSIYHLKFTNAPRTLA